MNKKQQMPFPLRLDADVFQWVREKAKEADRSINAEINRLVRKAKEAEEAEQARAA